MKSRKVLEDGNRGRAEPPAPTAQPDGGHGEARFSLTELVPRLIQSVFAGHVSRTTLLTRLLPLSLAFFCVTVGIGILLFPGPYDWRTRVISHVISPRHNPEGYWVPALGLAVAALLALPFAGYVERRLRPITPRLARWARVAFALGFLLVWSIVVPQYTEPVPGLRRLHETLARVSAACTSFGVVCCCLCALRDRLACFGGRQLLHRGLALCWTSCTLVPVICGVLIGAVVIGRKVDHPWAGYVCGLLQSTMLWQLAFWEWVGVVILFAFLFLSVLWLPAQAGSPAPTLAGPYRPPAGRWRGADA
jgi:hypothetical protein